MEFLFCKGTFFSRVISVVCIIFNFPTNYFSEKLSHPDLITPIFSIEGVPCIVVKLLKFFGRHMFRLKYHLICRVMEPVVTENSPFFLIPFSDGGVRKWRQNGKFRHIQFNLKEEIDESLDIFFVLIVRTEQDRAFNADAVVFQPLYPVPDNIRCIEDSLIHVPASRIGGKL